MKLEEAQVDVAFTFRAAEELWSYLRRPQGPDL